jgi:hypothetical protein
MGGRRRVYQNAEFDRVLNIVLSADGERPGLFQPQASGGR